MRRRRSGGAASRTAGGKEAKGSDRERGHRSDGDGAPQAQGEAEAMNESTGSTASLLLTSHRCGNSLIFPRDEATRE